MIGIWGPVDFLLELFLGLCKRVAHSKFFCLILGAPEAVVGLEFAFPRGQQCSLRAKALPSQASHLTAIAIERLDV